MYVKHEQRKMIAQKKETFKNFQELELLLTGEKPQFQ